MREFGVVSCSFWGSRDARALSLRGQLLALYLITGPHSNGVGCYRLPGAYIAHDLNWQAAEVEEAFGELDKIGFARREADVVLVPNFLRWNPIVNPNAAKARRREFYTSIAASGPTIRRELAASLLEFGAFWPDDFRPELERLSNRSGTVPKPLLNGSHAEPFANGSGTVSDGLRDNRSDPIRSDQIKTDQEERAPNGTRPASRIPKDFELTLERRETAIAEGLTNPERTFASFRDYWLAASGQKARKHDWDATWRTWCRREGDDNGKGGQHRPARVSAGERVRRATGVKL